MFLVVGRQNEGGEKSFLPGNNQVAAHRQPSLVIVLLPVEHIQSYFQFALQQLKQ